MKIEMTSLDARQTHDLLTSAIAPLPIALISTVGKDGVNNAAPYSLAIPISWKPPLVIVALGSKKGEKKDTLNNMEYTRDFVLNIMSEDALKPTIKTAGAYPSNVDEIQEVGLTAIAADKVKSPRIGEAPISIECRLSQVMEMGKGEDIRWLAFGEVILVHLHDEVWASREVNHEILKGVGRLGANAYCSTKHTFKL